MVEVRLPKALLQQHCQRQGWPPPRFERCAAGGLRLAFAGIRYSVTLVQPLLLRAKLGMSFTVLEGSLVNMHYI